MVYYYNRNQYLSKGRKVLVEGRLKQEKWTDKDTQKNHSRIRVVVSNFQFMDKKKDDADEVAEEACIPAEAGNDGATDDFDALDTI